MCVGGGGSSTADLGEIVLYILVTYRLWFMESSYASVTVFRISYVVLIARVKCCELHVVHDDFIRGLLGKSCRHTNRFLFRFKTHPISPETPTSLSMSLSPSYLFSYHQERSVVIDNAIIYSPSRSTHNELNATLSPTQRPSPGSELILPNPSESRH